METEKTLRVAIASDQAIFLRGLASLVMALKDAVLIAEARSGDEALQVCQLLEPDLFLLDAKNALEMARGIARSLSAHHPATKIMLLVDSQAESGTEEEHDPDLVYYISREVSEEEFKAAVEHVRNAPSLSNDDQAFFRHQPGEDEENQHFVRQNPRTQDVIAYELTMAARIQADILPEEAPVISGWELCAQVQPAHETSGDFYDFIPLNNHKWGLVVADVTDKGMGAALFMALTSTLIRNYANHFPTLPALTLSAVSERILSDTRGDMFVTAFLGILEPHTGRFTFANAGHPPGYLVSQQRGKLSVESLSHTGMALGVSETARWKQKIVRFMPGDYLILYTDGITEAQNEYGDFFGENRLIDAALERYGKTAREMQIAILDQVNQFTGNAPRQDDIAMIIIRRKE
jgi:serine phosphatase RsbU (regulator of sigma subunit)